MQFPLYHSDKINTWGLYYYVSNYTMKITGQTINTNPCLANVQRIVNLKNNNSETGFFAHVLSEVAKNFECEDIVVVPSSTPNINNLQKLFGVKMERLFDVPKQKNTKTNGITGGEKADFNPQSIEIHTDIIKGGKVLLVDDIAKTGETIKGCEKILLNAGYEVVKLVLGLSYHLVFEEDEVKCKQARVEHHKLFEQHAKLSIEMPDYLLPVAEKKNISFIGGDFVFEWFKMPLHTHSKETAKFLERITN